MASQSQGLKDPEEMYKAFEPKKKKQKNKNRNKDKVDEKTTKKDNIQIEPMENKKPLETIMDMKKLEIQPEKKATETESVYKAGEKKLTLTAEKTREPENMEIQTTNWMMEEELAPLVVEKPKENKKKQKPQLEQEYVDIDKIQKEETATKMDNQPEETVTKMDSQAGENATKKDNQAGQNAIKMDGQAGDNATNTESQTGDNATKMDSQAGENPTKMDSQAGYNATKLDNKAGENPTKMDSPAGENATKVDSQAGDNATKMDNQAGDNATKMDNQAGQTATKMDSQEGENPTKMDSQAGDNATKMYSQGGDNATEMDSQAGENATEMDICNVTNTENQPVESAIANKKELQTIPPEDKPMETPMEKDDIHGEEKPHENEQLQTEKQSLEMEKNEIQAAEVSEGKGEMQTTEMKKQSNKEEQLGTKTKEEEGKISEKGKETLQAIKEKQETSKRASEEQMSMDGEEPQTLGKKEQKQKKQKLQSEMKERDTAEEMEPKKAKGETIQQGGKKKKNKWTTLQLDDNATRNMRPPEVKTPEKEAKQASKPPERTTEQGKSQRMDVAPEKKGAWAKPLDKITFEKTGGITEKQGRTPHSGDRPQKTDWKQHQRERPVEKNRGNKAGEGHADKNKEHHKRESTREREGKFWREYKEDRILRKSQGGNSEQRSEGNSPCHSQDKTATKAHPEFYIEEIYGDLFTCPPTDSLAHCVSQDLHMGKGIAKTFRERFEHVQYLKDQNKGVGEVAVLEYNGRFVYYLVTKEAYYMKPTYMTLYWSLEAMKKHCLANQVTNLSMPGLGCGLDKLWWPRVKEILIDVFQDTPIYIKAYYLDE